MIVQYKMSIVARCPSDREPDLYHLTIESHRTIFVEHIIEFVKTFDDSTVHLSQEEITERIARKFSAQVTTTGNHYGVEVVCVA